MAKSNDMYVRNEVFLGWHRVVYGAVALAALTVVIFKTRLVESFLAFCFAGLIPGTNIVLPPDVVFWLMVTMAVATVLAAWVRMKINRARRRRHNWRLATAIPVQTAPVQIPVAMTQEAPVKLAVAIDPTPVRHSVPKRSMRLRFMMVTMFRSLGDFATAIGLFINKIALTIGLQSRVASKAVIRGLKAGIAAIVSAVVVTTRSLIRLVMITARFVYRASKQSWLWSVQMGSDLWAAAEPMLWKADEKLELVVRKAERWSVRKTMTSLSTRAVLDGVREYKKSLAFLTQPPLPKTVAPLTPKSESNKLRVPLNSTVELRNK